MWYSQCSECQVLLWDSRRVTITIPSERQSVTEAEAWLEMRTSWHHHDVTILKTMRWRVTITISIWVRYMLLQPRLQRHWGRHHVSTSWFFLNTAFLTLWCLDIMLGLHSDVITSCCYYIMMFWHHDVLTSRCFDILIFWQYDVFTSWCHNKWSHEMQSHHLHLLQRSVTRAHNPS